ncbi:MAG: terminase large subunit domain-containing protein [Candidatus Bipolaricaulia bacterium]
MIEKDILNSASVEQKIRSHQQIWEIEARDEQLPPDTDWQTWLIIAGRGWGKNRTAAEAIRFRVERGKTEKMLLISKNPTDAREDMVEDPDSGLLSVCSPHYEPTYEPGNKRVIWPDGQVAHIRTGAKPDNIRGGGYDLIWMDELSAWQYPKKTYEQAQFTARRGDPKEIITMTPKPLPIVTDLVEKSKESEKIHLTTGSTYDNKANLSEDFFETVVKDYEGTRLGKQELKAQILTDTPGALWDQDHFKYMDEEPGEVKKRCDRVVVAIDPATSNRTESDETGIIVAGKLDDQFYVLDDYSCKASPQGWASKAITAYDVYGANHVIAETNQGGDMVESTVQEVERVPFKQVHASRGKHARAEPIAALYEQGRVHHVNRFEELEEQLCGWQPGDDSPDRLDALVWALSELKEKNKIKATWGH